MRTLIALAVSATLLAAGPALANACVEASIPAEPALMSIAAQAAARRAVEAPGLDGPEAPRMAVAAQGQVGGAVDECWALLVEPDDPDNYA